MTPLIGLLDGFRKAAVTEREKGSYFEELIVCYLRNESTYRDLYSDVWTYAQWAEQQKLDKRDAGIDLVAKTQGTDEYHAIQCKLYAEDYRLQKSDIDSFFTASGKKPFSRRIIVSTTNHWSEPAEDALNDQQPPVNKIDLYDLENSQIDWARFQAKKAPALKVKKTLREHQKTALEAIKHGLSETDRGKLIMACGTGKTFAALKIAEELAGANKRVLFLVPSLNLLSQTLTEWTQESAIPLHSFAVCSDSDVGKKRKKDDDTVQTFVHELRYPATTEASRLTMEMKKRHETTHMSVVFSTYHSIDVIHRAQHNHGLPAFDLVVCDEAHRTTGATFENQDESNFVRVHDAEYLRAAKRLYMTATPRIYGNSAKASAEKDNVALYSMDDATLYGKELYVLSFSDAVRRGLLCDYKVIVLAVEEAHVNRRIQQLLRDPDNQLKVDDAAKIIGCWKALSKQGLHEELTGDAGAMRRAVAFCQVIEIAKDGKTHKVSSKQIAEMFRAVVEAYRESETDKMISQLACEAEHVDGSMNASEKEEKLGWLKADSPENTCRILSNVRCLSEGVDVPALDAVLFLTPRNSQVDVVQSVGRVMRNAPDKKRGYVVLPVVIPAGVEPHAALNDNKTYAVVWQVLQALRSHDDRFDAMVNKLDLIGKDVSKMEVIAITDKIQKKQEKAKGKTKGETGQGGYTIGESTPKPYGKDDQGELQFEIGEIERAIYAKLVQKVGNRHHWEDWANDIARIARTHIDRIKGILENKANTKERAAFDEFAKELRDDLNDSITDDEIIEMLAQHLITKPVFDALFSDYSFASQNPMSKAMQGVLDVLHEHALSKEADTLQSFYDSVKMRAEGIDNAQGKQKIVVELYDKFFRNAFPKMTERLGIVYTPVEVVDFIIQSVAHILQTEFGQTLGSKGVHIIDPFVGTGTFITRLMQSGLITPEQLTYKYKNEIHANEIVLLAYYIAAINIEAVYHSFMGGKYQPFEGICLTDTFQMYEKEDLVDALLVDNSARRKRQKKLDIRVIMANPPYSVGQASANDNNQNVNYPHLDGRIETTYAQRSKMTSVKNLYDSYIRAIRWASDRIGDAGVIGFVTNSGFVEKPAMDGMRKCLAEEYCNIYVLNLRGDIRKNMLSKGASKEGQNIFGSGSMAGIAISLLIKNPQANKYGQIFYCDIGNELSRNEKLEKISAFGGIAGIASAGGWQSITPDQHGDWLNQRDDSFTEFIALGDKKGNGEKLFENFSLGIATGRDAWCYNSSKNGVLSNMERMIDFYNDEVDRFNAVYPRLDKKSREEKINNFINNDPIKISWSVNLKQDLVRGRHLDLNPDCFTPSLYRPFIKQWLYYNRSLNERVYQMPKVFPIADVDNKTISINGKGSRNGITALMSDAVVDLNTLEAGAQCFPKYLYGANITPPPPPPQSGDLCVGGWREERILGADDGHASQSRQYREGAVLSDVSLRNGEGAMSEQIGDLFAQEQSEKPTLVRHDGITNAGLAHFQSVYPGETITKEDIFYYVYGLLHSPDYRERYADNLAKELPRIPRVKKAADFWAFSKAGRALGDLHVNYESVPVYSAAQVDTGGKTLTDADYRVEKMRYGKNGKDKDPTTLHYNDKIAVRGIPLEAYEYVVNGKPALDWVIERQGVRIDKDSGIVNDANDWAIETMGNPKYPLELFLRLITVSLETMKIVKSLPPLDI